jgi:tRNA(Arg) A34 adenosine deaminase TadA
MKKHRPLILVLVLLAVLFVLLLQSKFYVLHKNAPLTNSNKSLLTQLALQALKSNEVPVASIMVYNGRVIGQGYNTVLRDTNIGGHAEINAISNTIKNIGTQKFNRLNRDSLTLITTFEPCLMCRGAIIENRIKHVEFIKKKNITHWVKNLFKSLRYKINKTKINNATLQDSLFLLHPNSPRYKLTILL